MQYRIFDSMGKKDIYLLLLFIVLALIVLVIAFFLVS
jgi:hypothetical protein